MTVLRKRKAPGADQITAEMLKSDLVQTSQKLKFTKYGKRRKYPRSVSRDCSAKSPKRATCRSAAMEMSNFAAPST